MKKGEIIEEYILETRFPNRGIAMHDGQPVVIKGTLPGQKVEARITKIRNGVVEAKLLNVIERSAIEIEPACPHFDVCGGCTYQTLPYEEQLRLKEAQVRKILDSVLPDGYELLPTVPSPDVTGYRNKMEFSFGDEVKGGPLSLGMHMRGCFHGIAATEGCIIVDEDFRAILSRTLDYFRGNSRSYFHKTTKQGYLRYLIVRKAKKTGQILINLVTSLQGELNDEEFTDMLLAADLRGTIRCIAHSINDGVADVARAEEMRILYGQDSIEEELLGLRFNISSFSFFQTNSSGAEKLYSIVRDFIRDTKDKTIFDLYSGTGTIGQILAPSARRVIGIEIVEEAVKKANENARMNNLDNCTFIAGDVLTKIDELSDKPDIIVLDPPREGIHPKAIQKIIDYRPDTFIYISCKASSMAKDLPVFLENGYVVNKVRMCDMFPWTVFCECVVLITRRDGYKICGEY